MKKSNNLRNLVTFVSLCGLTLIGGSQQRKQSNILEDEKPLQEFYYFKNKSIPYGFENTQEFLRTEEGSNSLIYSYRPE